MNVDATLNIAISVNVVQLLVPLIAFGDFATNVYFITDLVIRQINGPNQYLSIIVPASLSFCL